MVKPFMNAYRPSFAGVELPQPQTPVCVFVSVCVWAVFADLTWRLVPETDAAHTIHTDASLIHLFSQSFLSFLPSLFFLWFSLSIHRFCYLRRQRQNPTLLKCSRWWHRRQPDTWDDLVIVIEHTNTRTHTKATTSQDKKETACVHYSVFNKIADTCTVLY